MNFFEEFLKANNLKKVEVADYLGLSKQSVSLMSSGRQNVSDRTLAMLKRHPTWDVSMLPESPKGQYVKSGKVKHIGILPQTAAAGYLGENNGPDVVKASEFIDFVDFFERSADFAIRVEGDSMYPRYNNGDVLACRILQDRNLFDYGRVYVLNTRNGCLVKKVLKDPEDGSRVVCHSENSDKYPDYEISKEDILGVAVVVGHAGVE